MFAAAVEKPKSVETGSKKQFISPDFYSQFDAWDGVRSNVTFTIGTTSKALQSIGVKEQEIKLHSGTVINKINSHPEMNRAIFRQIPELVENPVIVQFSDAIDASTGKEKYDSSITIMGEVYASDGRPVLVALDLLPRKNKGLKIKDFAVIKSAYVKEALQYQLNNNSILYIDPDKKRTDIWLSRTGLQLPVGETKYGPVRKITYSDGKVKIENSTKASPMEIALRKAGIVDSYGNSIFDDSQNNTDSTKKFIAPEAVAEMPGDQLTDEELLAQLRKRGMSSASNPLQIAQLRPEDADTTPPLRRNGPMNERGDGTSAFADSLQNTGIFSNELKQLAAEDENITRYDMITNKETLQQANEMKKSLPRWEALYYSVCKNPRSLRAMRSAPASLGCRPSGI